MSSQRLTIVERQSQHVFVDFWKATLGESVHPIRTRRACKLLSALRLAGLPVEGFAGGTFVGRVNEHARTGTGQGRQHRTGIIDLNGRPDSLGFQDGLGEFGVHTTGEGGDANEFVHCLFPVQ